MTSVSYHLEATGKAQALAPQVLRGLAATGAGGLVTFGTTNDDNQSEVYGRALNAKFHPSGNAFPLGLGGGGDVAVLSDGNVVATYDRSGVVYFKIISPIGVAVTVETMVSSGIFSNVAALRGGGFAINFENTSQNHIIRYVYDANGQKLPGSHTFEGIDSYSSGLANGGDVIAYADGSVLAKVYSPDPNLPALSITVDSSQNYHGNPAVVGLEDGGFAVAYVTDGFEHEPGFLDIVLQIFNADGSARTNHLLVNSRNLAGRAGDTFGQQFEPAVSQLKNGDIAVGWTSETAYPGDIKLRVFTPDGHAVTGITSVTHTPKKNDTNVALTTLSDGSLGVAWNHVTIVGEAMELVRKSVGTEGANKIKGDEITDHIFGKGGKDKLYGGDGPDQITGGGGADKMHAGKDDARDVFVFNPGDSSSSHSSRDWDHVYQFDAHVKHEAVSDKLDLSGLGVKWDNVSLDEHGKGVKVEVDYKGSGKADMIIDVLHVEHLHRADFIL